MAHSKTRLAATGAPNDAEEEEARGPRRPPGRQAPEAGAAEGPCGDREGSAPGRALRITAINTYHINMKIEMQI